MSPHYDEKSSGVYIYNIFLKTDYFFKSICKNRTSVTFSDTSS